MTVDFGDGLGTEHVCDCKSSRSRYRRLAPLLSRGVRVRRNKSDEGMSGMLKHVVIPVAYLKGARAKGARAGEAACRARIQEHSKSW